MKFFILTDTLGAWERQPYPLVCNHRMNEIGKKRDDGKTAINPRP